VRAESVKRVADLFFRYEEGERDFRGAKLSQANLIGVDLQGADLSGADLTGATLLGADLRGVKLVRADLTRAVLAQADIRGADLRGARLSGIDLRKATYDGATRFPAGFSPIDGGLMPQSGFMRRVRASDATGVLRGVDSNRRAGSK